MTTDLINQVMQENNTNGYKTRIVSMRVYDLDVEEQIGEGNSKSWKKNVNQNLPADYAMHNGNFSYIFENFYNWYDGEYHELNKVVKYPSINNSE